MEPPGRVEGSLAVRGGRIVYLGPDAGADALRGPKTRVIDLAGRAVTPGLIDAHSHLVGLGEALQQVDLTGVTTYEEVVRRVREAAAQAPAGAWVRGWGWDQNRWPGQKFPTRASLDAVLDRPIVLRRIDGHAVWVNGAALAAAKRRGVKLGGDRGSRPTSKQRARAVAVRQDRADARAADLAPVVKELQAAGAVSLRAIAAALDERGIPAARGGHWSANQVARLLRNIASPFGSAAASASAA